MLQNDVKLAIYEDAESNATASCIAQIEKNTVAKVIQEMWDMVGANSEETDVDTLKELCSTYLKGRLVGHLSTNE